MILTAGSDERAHITPGALATPRSLKLPKRDTSRRRGLKRSTSHIPIRSGTSSAGLWKIEALPVPSNGFWEHRILTLA